MIFSTHSKTPKIRKILDLGSSRSDFLPKFMHFGINFGIDFSDFTKHRKTSNLMTLPWFSHVFYTQSPHFWACFSLIFRVISKAHPRDQFWRSRAPFRTQKVEISAIFKPQGIPKSALGTTCFVQKTSLSRVPRTARAS